MPGSRPVPEQSPRRVLTVGPTPPEKLAYALARYSRSPDSIRESLAWVQQHDSAKFLESFYFQYGHASIADLGHLTVCFEGISELAATEIEDEPLWDGQARSSRYQDFSTSGVVIPPELTAAERSVFIKTTDALLSGYRAVHTKVLHHLERQLPQPEGMKPDAYQRNLQARAFDVARYLLPLAIPTGVGQVTSIRTLEKQIRRLRASEFTELRELGEELRIRCSEPPACSLTQMEQEAVAPTLARHAEPDSFTARMRANLTEWARDYLPAESTDPAPSVDLLQPTNTVAEICATLLYPVTTHSFRHLYQLAESWPSSRREDLLHLAFEGRDRRDELARPFRSAPYVCDILMDIGAYRDLHRHRRCHQVRQQYTNHYGFEAPEVLDAAGANDDYHQSLNQVDAAFKQLSQPAAQYLLPFAARSRFLFKMDFAELEYISRLRSGVKGHFSYRKIAWELKLALERLEPTLAALIEATPPWIEDPLKR